MAYYILVNDDDSLFCSKKERLMQRQKLVNDLIFIVDPIYRSTHNMKSSSVLLEYILPVSRKYETEYLVLSDELYKDYFLQYKLPVDTKLSAEAGEIELQLTFAWTTMDINGNVKQHVRKTSSTTVNIIPISAWSDFVPDSALAALDQRIIMQSAQINALADLANTINTNQVDNLVHNEFEDTLYLTANGKLVGNKIQVRDILDDGIPVVDLDSNNGNDSENKPDVGCICEDVVEF